MKKILVIAMWILLMTGFFILLGFTINANKNRVCESVHISFSNNSPYPLITESMIEEILVDNNIRVRGQLINELDVDQIENEILNAPHVGKARVYSDIEGELNIHIDQRVPIARIFNRDNESFYLDKEGKPIQLSSNYSARVVGITADFNLPHVFSKENQRISNAYEQVIKTVNFIGEDEFWKKQITHVHVNGEGEIELTPRVGNHKIMLGKATELGVKFDNLWNFYKTCEEHHLWNKYKTLNLKYRNQIVCTKK